MSDLERTIRNFNAARAHDFYRFADELDDLSEAETQSLRQVIDGKGEDLFLAWLAQNRNEVAAYMDATPKQRKTNKRWQEKRYLFVYARWHELSKAQLIYEWLMQSDQKFRQNSEADLAQLAFEFDKLIQNTLKLPVFPSLDSQDYPYPLD